MDEKLTMSKEMYLKAIYYLSQKEGSARSVDIAEFLRVSKPSVSVAIKGLSRDDLIDKDSYSRITLTPKGRQQALGVIEKHDTILFFLVDILGVDVLLAELDADRMEHIVSDETINRIEEYCELRRATRRGASEL